jgi:prevent-host-death family protein
VTVRLTASPVVVPVGELSQGYEIELLEELHRVLPIALAGATEEARQLIATVAPDSELAETPTTTVNLLVAALGGAAVDLVAAGLGSWLASVIQRGVGGWPEWLRPAIRADAEPKVVTLTKFSQERSRYVRELTDGAPVLLTRHGTVVAAVVPIEPGSYEEAAYPAALRRAHEQARIRRAAAGVHEPDESLSDPLLDPSGAG